MNFYWIKTNALIKKIFSNYVWDIPNTENKIYLTFDDGPTPEITEWVLEELEKHNAKATFFCIGNNIEKHPEYFRKSNQKWSFHRESHFQSFERLENFNKRIYRKRIQWSVISGQSRNCQLKTENCKLFRPPYGKIKASQVQKTATNGI